QLGIERSQRDSIQGSDVEAEVHGTIHGHYAESAAIGQNGQARAGHAVTAAQELAGGKQLFEAVGAHDAGAMQCGIEYGVGADDGTGVCCCGGRGLRMTARLQHHHRFQARSGSEATDEAPRVPYAFNVQEDAISVWVLRQIVEQVTEADVRRSTAGYQG